MEVKERERDWFREEGVVVPVVVAWFSKVGREDKADFRDMISPHLSVGCTGPPLAGARRRFLYKGGVYTREGCS